MARGQYARLAADCTSSIGFIITFHYVRGGLHIVLLWLALASALELASSLTLRHPLSDFFWVHQDMIPAI